MKFKLNEDFFDDIEQDEIVNTDIDNDTDKEIHKFIIGVNTLRDIDYSVTYINNNKIREIDRNIRAFCYQAFMFDSYEITYLKPGDDLTDFANINDLPTFRYKKFRVKIEYVINRKTSLKLFASTIQKLSALIYKVLTDRFNYRLTQTSMSVNIENENGLIISYLHPEYLNDVYRTIMGLPYSIECDYKGKKANYSVTPAPKLSSVSKKKLRELEIGDVLYSTRNGELVLDEETNGKRNNPIAIYAMRNQWSNCPCFVSIKYMSNINPKSGSVAPVEMFFGANEFSTEQNHDWRILEDPLVLNSQLYDYLNKMEEPTFTTDSFVKNAHGRHHMPPVQSCYRFSPYGTKKGQWYIPNLQQLHDLYKNIEDINQTRRNLGYEELAECYFYSCNETADKYVAVVDLENNREDRYQAKNQQEDLFTIAFINVTE